MKGQFLSYLLERSMTRILSCKGEKHKGSKGLFAWSSQNSIPFNLIFVEVKVNGLSLSTTFQIDIFFLFDQCVQSSSSPTALLSFFPPSSPFVSRFFPEGLEKNSHGKRRSERPFIQRKQSALRPVWPDSTDVMFCPVNEQISSLFSLSKKESANSVTHSVVCLRFRSLTLLVYFLQEWIDILSMKESVRRKTRRREWRREREGNRTFPRVWEEEQEEKVDYESQLSLCQWKNLMNYTCDFGVGLSPRRGQFPLEVLHFSFFSLSSLSRLEVQEEEGEKRNKKEREQWENYDDGEREGRNRDQRRKKWSS